MSLMRRLHNVLRPGRVEREIDRELAFHVAERADALEREGVNHEEASRHARRQLGSLPLHAERTRDADILPWLDAALRQIRVAGRSLRRTPGFSAAVVLTLALGIGANSAIFSALDGALFRPLPFVNGDRLVRVSQMTGINERDVAGVRVADWDRLNTTFDAMTSYVTEDVSDTTGEIAERVRRATVMPRFLEVWGIHPLQGRDFTDAEHRLGGSPAVLVSERYWRRRLGADPDVLDRAVRMGERSYSIVGVLPASFMFPDRGVDWWVPQWVDAPWTQNRTFNSDRAIGRLRAGVSLQQAQADLERVQRQLADGFPRTDRGITPRVVPLRETLVGDLRGSLWLLFGAVSLLLLIACTNIAALLLSRAARRRDEVAIRYSLGASRAAVGGQMLAEAGVLSVAGAAAGLLVAAAAAAWLRRQAPGLPQLESVAIDARVLLYTTAVAAGVALACGMVPALRSMRGAAAHTALRTVTVRQSLQWWLVGVQVALSVTLLVGAGLLVRSLDALSRVDPGFDPARVLAFRVSASFGEEQDYDRTVARINRTLDALMALPDVEVAATALQLPGVPGQVQQEFTVVEAATGVPIIADSRLVSFRYFDTMRIPLIAGTPCRQTLTAEGTTEVLVNNSFVERYFPGRNIVGLHMAGGTPDRIVGVVGDARERGIDTAPAPTVYSCFSAGTPFPWFLVRTPGDPAAAAAAIRRTINELEPLRAVHDVAPLEQWIGDVHAQDRLRTTVLALFAVAALSLACLGTYATIAYAVSLRRREIGLRLAIGARRGAIVNAYLGKGLRVAGVAAAIGVVLAVALSRLLSGMLFGVSPYDPLTLSGVFVLVLVVGGTASFVPAARAALVQPMQVLREE